MGVIRPCDDLVKLVKGVVDKLACLVLLGGLDLGEVASKGMVDHDGVVDTPRDKDCGLVHDTCERQEYVCWVAWQCLARCDEVRTLVKVGERNVFVTIKGTVASPCQWLM